LKSDEEESDCVGEGDAIPTLVTFTFTTLAPSTPIAVRLVIIEFSAALEFTTPAPLTYTVTTVELTPSLRDAILAVFWQFVSLDFNESGSPAQIESKMRFVSLSALAILMLSESESLKMLVLELPEPRVI
jgi:hypothetical protein